MFGYAKVKLEDVCNSISSGNARTKENEGNNWNLGEWNKKRNKVKWSLSVV